MQVKKANNINTLTIRYCHGLFSESVNGKIMFSSTNIIFHGFFVDIIST